MLPPAPRNRGDRLMGMAVVLAAALLLIYLVTYNPQAPFIQTPPCIFRTITGLYCPGCGTRSALIQLARGNFYAAWRLNPLTVTTLPAGIIFVVSQAYTACTGRSLPRIYLPASWIWVLLALIMIYWTARNLTFHPFNLIRPTVF